MAKRNFLLFLAVLLCCEIVFAQSYKQIYEKIRECAARNDAKCIAEWVDKGVVKSQEGYQKSTDEYYGLMCEKIAIYLGAQAKINPKAYEFQTMYMEEALRVYKNHLKNYVNNYIILGYQLGTLYRELSQYNNAVSTLEEVLPVLEKAQGKNNDNYINFKYELGQNYRLSGSYLKAKQCIDEVFPFTEKNHPKDIEMINILQERAAYYTVIGLYETAEQDYRKAIEIINSEPQMAQYKNTRFLDLIGELGKLYVLMGKYTQAEDLMVYEMSHRNISKDATPRERKEHAQLLNSLAALYIKIGRYEDALKLSKVGLEEIEKAYGKNHIDYYINLETLAQIYLLLGLYDRSIGLFLECKEGTKNLVGEKHVFYGLMANNTAECYRRMGKNLEAKQNFELAKAILEQNKFVDNSYYALIVNNVAVTELELKNYLQAERMFAQALQLMEKSVGKNNPDYQIILSNLSILCSINGKLDKAKEYAIQSKNHYLNQIQSVFPTMTEKEKLEFISIAEMIFNNFTVIAAKNASKQPELLGELYNNILAVKGIATSSTIKTRQKILNSGDAKLINLYQQWQKTNQMIAKGALMTPTEQKNAGIDLDSLNRSAQSLSRDIAYLSKDMVKETEIAPTWQDVQKKLTDGEAAIEVKKYVNAMEKTVDSSEYAILIITPKSTQPTLVVLKNGFKLENEYFTLYSRNVKNKLLDEESYNYYWKPIAEKLSGVKRIYFSPDGVYNKISLLSLYNPNSKRYLIEECEVILLHNTRDLLKQKPNKTIQWANTSATLVYNPTFNANLNPNVKNKERGSVEVLTGSKNIEEITRYGARLAPLPGTREEGEKIKQILQNRNIKVQALDGEKATEEVLKSQNAPTILHIATHGFFLPHDRVYKLTANSVDIDVFKNPMLRSGLYLAGSTHPEAGKNDRDNGILTAFEIQNLNLDNTELVVLSACETGLGELSMTGGFTQLATGGEGVFGLQRAFKIAGAKHILMSLWKVNDQATNLLMQNFYTELAKTGDIKVSFIAAQNALRKMPEFSHPYFWGAFVLIGE
ncbi:MAG: CHAT domain-containing protein [Bacteroidia bacterium]|nr:CHAT domain-containing protein [Bacteroidia bacterium]MDW8347061.1 CHAT domain-containing tetratricopeptide repeat protein [Bacteroidia bacterium]